MTIILGKVKTDMALPTKEFLFVMEPIILITFW
jgi:hypothetical protein